MHAAAPARVALHTAANGLVRAFLAPECAACHVTLDRPLASPVCDACWRAVSWLAPPLCVRCGDARSEWRSPDFCCPRCRRQPPLFSFARSGGRYEGALRLILYAFKYDRRRALAGELAALMAHAGADALDGADAVVPVPLHPWRTWQRGFNQADDLACALGLPVWRALRRRRHDPPQASLPAARRHANVRGTFALSAPTRALPWLAHRLRGSVVVLVDDVMTTGATLDACARVLIDARVREVRVLTVARAVATQPARSPEPPRLSAARH
jgi:ComF family protein